MKKGELMVGEAVLCALYLRGSPYRVVAERRAWPRVVEILMTEQPVLGNVETVLRKSGRFEEASCLTPSALDWGVDLIERRAAITFLDPCYPRGWVCALGSAAPPCAWIRGRLSRSTPVAVVGTRQLDKHDRQFVEACAVNLMSHGCTLVSGGAVGTDSVAVGAATGCGDPSRCVVVLPTGLQSCPPEPSYCALSVCEPDAGFTTGQAMERNALVYAFGRRALSVRPRFRTGGTWHGAVDALRRQLATVLVLDSPSDAASRALIALGARPIRSHDEIQLILESAPVRHQPDLFGACRVREGESAHRYAAS